jgi:hypothetical protein
MKPLLRAVGAAVLALALLNASAGLCFCHRGPVLPGESSESAGCCHGPDSSGGLAVGTAGTCCHIESAESAATPVIAVQLAQPGPAAAVAIGRPSAVRTFSMVAGALPGASPPLFILRI